VKLHYNVVWSGCENSKDLWRNGVSTQNEVASNAMTITENQGVQITD
jgi:hypothetical protein